MWLPPWNHVVPVFISSRRTWINGEDLTRKYIGFGLKFLDVETLWPKNISMVDI